MYWINTVYSVYYNLLSLVLVALAVIITYTIPLLLSYDLLPIFLNYARIPHMSVLGKYACLGEAYTQ
jgi:hypothetical protein